MKVLVSGATGYLGGRVATLAVAEGHDVTALLRPESDPGRVPDGVRTAESGDGPDDVVASVRGQEPDVILHLAAAGPRTEDGAGVSSLVRGNVEFGALLLQGLVEAGGGGFVHAGSFWEAREGGASCHPVDLYAATKAAFRAVLCYYSEAQGVGGLTLRLFGTYGPEDPRGRIFSHLRQALDSDDPIPFTVGEQRLDLVHVEDVARAFLAAAGYVGEGRSSPGEVIDVGTGTGLTLRELATLVEAVAGRPLNIDWGALPYRSREVMAAVADPASAEERLGWRPTIPLARGVAQLFGAAQERS